MHLDPVVSNDDDLAKHYVGGSGAGLHSMHTEPMAITELVERSKESTDNQV